MNPIHLSIMQKYIFCVEKQAVIYFN